MKVQLNASLKNFPFQKLPIHLREKIEAEMDRLVKGGVIEPINTAICAFPTVNVIKPYGKVRICGDFKPLNKVLVGGQHPIAHPNELFSTLAGGEKFIKLDLLDAYNQLPLDEENQQYLVMNTYKGFSSIVIYLSESVLPLQFFKGQWAGVWQMLRE